MKIKTTKQLLQCIPSRTIGSEINPKTGFVRLIKPKFNSNFAKKILGSFVKGENFIINLDELGTEVWNNIDGYKTVGEIGRKLGMKFGSDIEPIYERLNKFIIQLQRNKFIRLDCPELTD